MTPPNFDDADEPQKKGRRFEDRWHVGREIPIALILALVMQTGGGVWWASNMSSKLDMALQSLAEFRAERYTKDDARRDRELYQQIVEGMRARDIDIERRLATVERQHEAMTVNGKVK